MLTQINIISTAAMHTPPPRWVRLGRAGMSATTAAFPGSSHYGAFRAMVQVM